MLPRPPFPRPSAAAADEVRAKLHRVLGGSKVLTAEEALARFAGDESEQAPVLPDAVVLAETADDVARTLQVASELGVAVTPRGGGSGKSGGAVPVCGGIVLATLGLRAIKEIDARELTAVVEPGVMLGDLYAAVEAEGLFYPPDPNSFAICALGGNIAENAGGPRAFKYGVTREYVLGLEVLTAEGTRLRTGRRTRKGVTGYDVTALLVGSEGTLAVTLEATLRLLRKPEQVVTLLALFDGVATAAGAVAAIVAAGLVPRCLEIVDEAALDAMRAAGAAVDGRAGALLLIEIDGDAHDCDRDMERVGELAMAANAIDVLVAQDAAQRDRLWSVRRELSNILRRTARYKISEDVVVPRGRLPELVADVRRIAEETGVRMPGYGHAGDGNLHVNLLWDDPDAAPAVERALDALFKSVLALGGTLSGEHGIGTSKAEFLPLEQSAELIELQRGIKRLFDPKNVLNPGKIFPRRGHGSC
jgi:glycolate dehydrogenase FAD-linked subunit